MIPNAERLSGLLAEFRAALLELSLDDLPGVPVDTWDFAVSVPSVCALYFLQGLRDRRGSGWYVDFVQHANGGVR